MMYFFRNRFSLLSSLSSRLSNSRVASASSFSPALICAITIAGLLLFAPDRLAAQVNSASLRGTVTDAAGAAVEGAQVSVEFKETSAVRTTTTNGTGEYSLSSLQPGIYIISITKTGFSTFKETNFSLEVGAVASLDAALKVGNISEVVEVK